MGGFVTALLAPRDRLFHAGIFAAIVSFILLTVHFELQTLLAPIGVFIGATHVISEVLDRPAAIIKLKGAIARLSDRLEQSGFQIGAAQLRLALDCLDLRKDGNALCLRALKDLDAESPHFIYTHRKELRKIRRALLNVMDH
jgi:hypothetical protein